MTMGPRTSHPSHTVGRYLASTGDGELDFCRADTFAALESLMDKRRPVLSIIDCHSLARLIGERAGPVIRSEEHTSELQSLMRISYAVFCLKKQNAIN